MEILVPRNLKRGLLYLISPALRTLEVIILKNAERAGIIQRCPTGMDEVEYSDVTKTESGRGCGLGRDGYRQGDVVASSQGTSGNTINSTE